jgi:hypothetical protein
VTAPLPYASQRRLADAMKDYFNASTGESRDTEEFMRDAEALSPVVAELIAEATATLRAQNKQLREQGRIEETMLRQRITALGDQAWDQGSGRETITCAPYQAFQVVLDEGLR